MSRSYVLARPVLTALCLSVCLSSPLLAQRSDRAVISGVVTDAQGAALPGAAVTVKNEATGVENALQTNNAGAYTTNPLVLGPYSVSVNLTGFKKALASGIVLRAGDVIRHDVQLQIGEMAESVEVVGGEALDSTRPDVSHSVDEKYYRDLPIVTAADVKLAESVLLMQPGYLPMTPNGDPMFRGSQFNSRINGGQARATENFFDGGAFGYASGHQGSQESAPPVEAIQEVTVVTTTYSAQYGHTSGGFIEYTSKSGTNTFHASAYGNLAQDCLNTQGFFKLPKTPLDNKNWGATVGGPIIKNKTFFFVNADWTRFRSGALRASATRRPSTPSRPATSRALLGSQIGVDALGRPILQGQIFNPATTRTVNGVLVRDPYPGNVIPANDPLRSRVAANYAALMVTRTGPAFRTTWPATRRAIRPGSWTHETSFSAWTTASRRSSRRCFSGYYNNRPSVRNCGGAQGCTVAERPPRPIRLRTRTTSARASPSASTRSTPTPSGTGSSTTT